MQNLAQRVREIMTENIYINITTCSRDAEPRDTPVYAVHDDMLNFFRRSRIKSDHSQNIQHHENVFITIYDSTRPLGTNHQRCIYIKAKAYEITKQEEIEKILALFTNNTLTADNFLGESVKRVYKAIPEKIRLNDKSESEVTADTTTMRVEVSLEEIINLLHIP